MNPEQPVSALIATMQDRLLRATTYAGVVAIKSPLDAWMYQEIVWQRRPRYIIEIGNWRGGGLLMYCHWLDAIGAGQVIGIDHDHSLLAPRVREHPRLALVTGDAEGCAERVAQAIEPGAEVLIIEDSSHRAAQTLAVLRAYHELVRIGGYFIVEDTICWHGLDQGPRPGPYEAVQEFIAEQGGRWQVDAGREAFGVTWNPSGYLRRVY